ncbi:transcriptional regulatory protein ChvI [Spirochaetia bacterium]|nr:transcriptional regulatory protein ChvI [Spirochaetia bacterium]
MSRIAVVDDEKNIREVIRIALEKEFHEADEYGDGLAAWEAFQSRAPVNSSGDRNPPDLIVLDIVMPRMDGIELCRRVRSLPWGARTPIIFLSSRDEEIDKVLGLESGGDDYVSKPFSLRELMARIRAGLRRKEASESCVFAHDFAIVHDGSVAHNGSETAADGAAAGGTVHSGDGVIRRGDLLLDENRCAAYWKSKPIELTVTEFRIVQTLISFPGFIKTREQLMAAAFPEDNFPNDKAADSHIKRIRRKFLELDSGFVELEAVYGLGYRWKESA